MIQQDGFTKENIDKSKVLISEHAKNQFIMRVGEAYCLLKNNGTTPWKKIPKIVGLPIISTRQEAEFWIHLFLERSTAENAATNGKNIDSILKYLKTRELSFYLRYQRWQFVIKRCDENPAQFIIKTVIWLDEGIYSRLKK